MANQGPKPVKVVETALRDGHQSLFATRMTTPEVLLALPELDRAGYHALEIWGGATFDACIRFNDEDPWDRLRQAKAIVKHTKLQMLFRGQNILGYRHYSDDIVDLFVKKSLENGIDIIRIFDALNDLRNLKQAVDSTKKYGGECQIALSYTTSPVHTIDYFVGLAKEVEAMGADSICIKDMAGVLLPTDAKALFTALKSETRLPLELHTHSTGGVAPVSMLEAIEAGCDIVDTALSPISGGTSQPATESLAYMLKGTPHDPGLNLEELDKAAVKLTKVKDKYLANGLLNPKSLTVNPNILKYQVPGGMLSNLMKQLKDNNMMDRYEDVLREVPRVRQEMGYPPLVTPLSQMVGTQAVMNIITGERYKMIPKEIVYYVKGLYGKNPAPIDQAIAKKVLSYGIAHDIIKDDVIITHRPADDLKPEFEGLKEKYKDLAKSDEDILSLALFEQVAVKFLEKKYNPDEIIEVNLYI